MRFPRLSAEIRGDGKSYQMIKPVRFNGSRSLHFYSEHENFQFDKESTMKWYRRFDAASAELDQEDEGKPFESVRFTRRDGDKGSEFVIPY